MEVIIIGGSISGLMQGIVLCRSGHKVHILEQSTTPPEGRGAGISCRENAKEFLNMWDVTRTPYYVNSENLSFLGPDGEVQRAWSVPMQMTSWKSLYYKLRANFDGLQSDYYPERVRLPQTKGQAKYDSGQTVTDVRYKDGQVIVEYESTDRKITTLYPDLVIAADGSRSRIRHLVQPDIIPQYAGYVAWRGMVPEKDLSEDTREHFGEHASLLPMVKGHILMYLVPGEHGSLKPGERLVNWTWYSNYHARSKELAEIMTDEEGHLHRNLMPIGKVRTKIWNRQKRLAGQSLPPLIAELVQKTSQPFIQAINDVRSPCAAFFDGKLLIVGDALAGFRPHSPASTEQAALDALLLHRVLQHDITITEWEKKVLSYSNIAGLHSKTYGIYWQFGLTPEFFVTLFQFGVAKLHEWASEIWES